ncbi:ORF6N domain-containing protein [candidate division FCPU426 bacterium]|nr:ORF6N domain-containing protein [candidate division FCPU426 bacterium]
MAEIIPFETIERKIYFIRGKKVMLDRDLAKLYGVEIKALNQAVKRNKERFPEDFMFQLEKNEDVSLRSQIVTLKRGEHRKYPSYAFTENGVAMLSSVLRSRSAIQVNIQIMRAFTKIRELMGMHKHIFRRLSKLELEQLSQAKGIKEINRVIRKILNLPITLRRRPKPMGFKFPKA